MSYLPQSWHGVGNSPSKPVNPVTPLKRPRTLKLSSRTSVNGPQLTYTAQSERRTWSQRPTFDPSTIDSPSSSSPVSNQILPGSTNNNNNRNTNQVIQRPTKPTMPVSTTKLRAKSIGNGQELKTRLNDENSMEILALRKELTHMRDENVALKGKMRRVEEESAKKVKQLEKQLASVKKDFAVIEKKREVTDESLAALKQKYQRLETELRSKDLTMRKMQVSLKTPPRTNDRSISVSRNANSSLLTSGSSNIRPMPTSNARPLNKVTSPSSVELLRLREANKKLLQENAKLLQQLKEREQEIKTLKINLTRNQKNSASTTSSRLSSAPSNKEMSSTNSSASVLKPTRVSRTSLHRTITKTTTVTTNNNSPKPIKQVKTKVIQETFVNGIPKEKKKSEIKPKSKDESIQELQRKTAARKIQRSWRSHRDRAKQGQVIDIKQDQPIKIADEILLPEDHKELLEEDIEYLQSVLKGHLDRVEQTGAQFQNLEMTEEMAANIEALHQNCFESMQKDGEVKD